MGLIRKHDKEPVYVTTLGWRRDRIGLRIGPPEGRGKSRVAVLEPSEARQVAYGLLLYAEQVRERIKQKT